MPRTTQPPPDDFAHSGELSSSVRTYARSSGLPNQSCAQAALHCALYRSRTMRPSWRRRRS